MIQKPAGRPSSPEQIIRDIRRKALANRGMDTRSLQAYLGHASIVHTVRYTEMSPTRFRGIWH